MAGGIYLVTDSGELVEMRERTYASEELLQELLAKYPQLLAGDQIDSTAPRRWLLVTREMGVPSEEDGGNRWAVDHLFLDQDGVPTIVEVKRSNDTRIRREVVGQMLDYAANGVVYWPIEEVRSRFERTCETRAAKPADVLAEFLGPEADPTAFWQSTKTNLQAGRVRLVFVADRIPPELRRIVEFLNSHMDPTEILAIEIKQYVGGEKLRTLVPRVIGQTEEAQQKKSAGVRDPKQWDEQMFFADLRARRPEGEAVARAILNWAQDRGMRISWGRGGQDGSFFLIIDRDRTKHYLISVWTYGRLEVLFELMKTRPPFDNEARRCDLLHRLNQISGAKFPEDAIMRRPRIDLADLTDKSFLEKFLGVLDWALTTIKES
jgi:hypothetical protein